MRETDGRPIEDRVSDLASYVSSLIKDDPYDRESAVALAILVKMNRLSLRLDLNGTGRVEKNARKDTTMRIPYQLRPYKTIRHLRACILNQADMIENIGKTAKNRMAEVRRLRTELGKTERDLLVTEEELRAEKQANDNLAQVNASYEETITTLHAEVERLDVSLKIANDATVRAYGDGLNQGHVDAWYGNLPPCKECGQNMPDADTRHHREGCHYGIRG